MPKKRFFYSNKNIYFWVYFKVEALNRALLISPIYCEAKGNKVLVWSNSKNHYVRKKKRGEKWH